MLPYFGPPIIEKCTECSGLLRRDIMASDNTFGATFWTDGYTDDCFDESWLIKCPHCEALIWSDEIEKVNAIDDIDSKKNYERSKPCELLKVEDYFEKLKENNLDSRKLKYIRMRIWWMENSKRRNTDDKIKLSDKERDNLLKLYDLLSFLDDDELLLKAEIKRELGEFKEAEAILEKPISNDLRRVASTILKLARQQNEVVAKIKSFF